MKTQKLLFTIGTVAALTFMASCGSKDTTTSEPPTQDSQTVAPPVAATTPDAATTASGAVEAAKPAVEKAVADTKAAASTAAADVTAKFNSVVDQAKALLGQNKYTEALNTLQQLSGLKLTPEQEKIVSDLKAQIQKLMAAKATTDGASAVGNLLKK